MTIDGPPAPPTPPTPPTPPERQAPGGFTVPEESGALGDDTRPEPGALNLAGRRAWKTWQLAAAILVAALFGMWFNGNSGSASTSSATSGGSGGGAYKLPPSGGSSGGSGGSTASTTTTTTAGGSTTTTTAGGSTTTTTAGGATSTTAPVVVGPATVLVPATQLTGNWTSPTFNIAGGTWNIGWAFSCDPVPAATPTFAVYAVNAGASAGSTPAVTSSAPSGQSVTPLTSTGSQQIIVQAPTGCRWAVKVTGSSS